MCLLSFLLLITGSFNAFPGKGNKTPTRDSSISLLDILDERNSLENEEPHNETDTSIVQPNAPQGNTFAREGTVQNPVYFDAGDEGDPEEDKDLHDYLKPSSDDTTPSPNDKGPSDSNKPENPDDDDFHNIFDDDYFKDNGPVTLLSYAKKHEEEKEDEEENPSESSDLEDDPLGPQYEPVRDPSSLGVDPTKEESPYATISKKPKDNDTKVNTGDPEQDTKEAYPDIPLPSTPENNGESPNLPRTGSVAKLVNAFAKGKVNKAQDEEREDDAEKRPPNRYTNPLYQEEDKLISYSNPLYKDDEEEESTPENQYLAPVDTSPQPTKKDPPTPVPTPRPNVKNDNSEAPPPGGNKGVGENYDAVKKPQSPPPPPPLSSKPNRGATIKAPPEPETPTPAEDIVNPPEKVKKQPPAVAPKRVSLKNNKTPLDRAMSAQPTRKAPAPPPRVRSVRY